MKKWGLVGLTGLLLGCSHPQNLTSEHSRPDNNIPPIAPTLYDYTLHTPDNTVINLNMLAIALADADVVLIGEWHGHPAAHLLQAQLLAALHAQNPKITLSMEQFTRDKQHIVNQYLASEIGEKTLIKKGHAWPNYSSDYRPLVEFAKQQHLDVIASNAPKSIVRCIGKEGAGYLTRLPDTERKWVAEQLTLSADAYHQRFYASMHHGDEATTHRQFAAQTAWDDTMAESIVNYLALFPNKQIIHLAGRFHVIEGLGIASRIHSRNPNLNIKMITPVTAQSPLTDHAPDYTFTIQPMPTSYINKAEMDAAMKTLFHQYHGVTCYP
ncbi:ChaN family lipoprotein [Photobacterium nomapromontoriensis]|uniref:ChaN family lipoprotein n=1 Tax=Photobacterium nomapromontoriensis TaxID=2910237 RepID=UPI003D1377F3